MPLQGVYVNAAFWSISPRDSVASWEFIEDVIVLNNLCKYVYKAFEKRVNIVNDVNMLLCVFGIL